MNIKTCILTTEYCCRSSANALTKYTNLCNISYDKVINKLR